MKHYILNEKRQVIVENANSILIFGNKQKIFDFCVLSFPQS